MKLSKCVFNNMEILWLKEKLHMYTSDYMKTD